MITTHAPRNTERTRELLNALRRHRARIVFAERLEADLSRFRDPEAARPVSMTILQLSKRWRVGRRILNLDLINASTSAIDYVPVYELY